MSRNFTFGISLSFSFDQEGFALACVRVCVCVHDKVTGLYLTSVRACVRECVRVWLPKHLFDLCRVCTHHQEDPRLANRAVRHMC